MILTWDNAAHAIAAVILVYLLHFLGPWALPAAISIGFYAREMEQAADERWRPDKWSPHKHAEWLVPAAVAFATFGFI